VSKDPLDKAADAIKRTVDDAKDKLHEVQHKAAADAEKSHRDTEGDKMTASEKVGSAVSEAKNRVQAEIDRAKRKAREHT